MKYFWRLVFYCSCTFVQHKAQRSNPGSIDSDADTDQSLITESIDSESASLNDSITAPSSSVEIIISETSAALEPALGPGIY